MRHRIFVAINLPQDIKEKLVEYQAKWPELPVRWTEKENLHITLEFLGDLTDEELIELCQKTTEIASEKKTFAVHLNKICYGPPNKKPPYSMSSSRSFQRSSRGTPRMVWVTGEKIKEFNIAPHITLGRIKTWEFRRLELEERPQIAEDIDLTFEVASIEVMESDLKREGPEYVILESCLLKS